jgi:hypothetical protein
MNVIALLFFLAAVLVFLLGLFKVAIPDPVLLGLALFVIGVIVDMLGAGGIIINRTRQP